jgi:hypothetical protein
MIRDGAHRPTALRTKAFSAPTGHALFALLRGNAAERPVVDPGLAGGLREWLEDELGPVADELGPLHLPFLVDRRALNVSEFDDRPEPRSTLGQPVGSVPLVHNALVECLFRQIVTEGRIDQPYQDAMDGLLATGQSDLVRFVKALTPDEQSDLQSAVNLQGGILQEQWLEIPSTWLPRTKDWVSIPVAGGRIILSGVLDLVLGAASTGRASVCLVDVKSSQRRPEDPFDRHLLAVLETLRSGASPFRLATYYSATGEIDVEEVTEDLLAGTVAQIIERTRARGASLRTNSEHP